jgi:hypothetical protein
MNRLDEARPRPSGPVWSRGALLAALLALPSLATRTAESGTVGVVFNEIMYHPPDDRDDLQFVELLNAGATGIDLAGWSLTQGVRFNFPPGTRVEAGGCVVVCRDATAFAAQYPGDRNVAGTFTGKLRHGGERVALTDPGGHVVDAVKFSDQAPWSLGADGYGASLERICPAAPGQDPDNWTAAELQPEDRIGGTPGRTNSCYSAQPLPRISGVRCERAEPGKPIAVRAVVGDPAGLHSVTVAWWVGSGHTKSVWTEVPMVRDPGDVQGAVYSATIPPQPEGRLIRFTVRAVSTSGAERVCPSRTEPRPTYSCSTFVNTNQARVPFLQVLTFGAPERPRSSRSRPPPRRGTAVSSGPRELFTSAVVYLPRDSQEAQVFDHVHVRQRKGGWKIHFHRDQPLLEMTGFNLLFEMSPRWLLAEWLSYDLYRKAGVPSPNSLHARLWMDERPLGYHLLVEQPNRTFFRRHERDADGNLYKLLWYGHGLVGQHEKRTHRQTGHQDLTELVEGLNGATGAAQWEFIQKHFNVEEMINYYAVNMCIQNWDGFWNNYYTLHDLRPGGKWEVFPWDEDKTWGDYDGSFSHQRWYEMPLTFGMNGDPPTGSFIGGGPFGGSAWWRPPGHFSGPLLANPQFRQRFLARLREMCETIFTPQTMGPAINALESRLTEEVRVRAALTHQDAARRLSEFQEDIQSFRRQVVNRRAFILKELAAAR